MAISFSSASLALVLACFPILISCDDGYQPPPDNVCWPEDLPAPTPGANVDFGIIEDDEFRLLRSGESRPLVAGIQGLHHVSLNLLLTDILPGTEAQTRTNFTITTNSGTIASFEGCTRIPYSGDFQGKPILRNNRPVVVDESLFFENGDDEANVRVEVLDSTGVYAEASIDIVLFPE